MVDTAGEQRWHRSRYPLQGFSEGSPSVSQATLPSKNADNLQLKGLSNGTQSTIDPASPYRIATDDRLERDASTSGLGINDNSSSYQPTMDFGAYDESSNGVSMSQRSVPPLSVTRDYRPPLGEAESPSSSTQPLRNGHSEGTHVSSPEAKCPYPLQSTTETSAVPLSPIPGSPPEEEYEQRLGNVPQADHLGATKRTLRRTPRSRRILAPISPAAVEQAAPTAQLPENGQSMAASCTNPWKRQSYPSQSSATSVSTTQYPVPPQPEQELTLANDAYSGQLKMNESDHSASASLDRRATPRQSFNTPTTALPASPPVSESESEDLEETTPLQSHNDNRTVKEHKPWHRQTYPLQTPASNASLRCSPTPPSSPGREANQPSEESEYQFRKIDQAATGNKILRRQIYPLQSSASVADLGRLSTPPPTPKRASDHSSKEPEDQIREVDQTATSNTASLRRIYPLQSPASVVNVRHPNTPPPPLQREEHPSDGSDDHIRKIGQAPPRNKALRQTYPLQSPASVADLRHSPASPASPASPSLGTKDQGKSHLSANQVREHELATKVVKHWRRQVYPLQSPENVSFFQRLPTPQPQEEEGEQDNHPRSIHLPKNIRAITGAEKHDSEGRTIVVCLDGTGDKFDNDNSNIVHLISALKKDDAHQVTYYQAGIGTYGAGGLSGGVTAALDMAVGAGLGLHVRDAYHFLMHTYKEGDKICILGFSRGAYTARCLAGMIHKVGLLPPRNLQQIPFAYEFYTKNTPEGWKQSYDFKKTFCIDVCVYFLGCFDSVASVGFIPRQLPLSSTPTNKCRYFRHAMALDERRAKFKVCRHQRKDWDEINKPPKVKSRETSHPNVTDEEYESLTGHEGSFDTDVLEVWFAGAHADIGGGAVPNDERHKLAQIPLRWMIRQAFECDTGIIFKTAVLAEYGLDVHTLWPKYQKLSAPAHGPPPSFLEKYDKGLPPRSIRRNKLVPIDRHEKGEQLLHLRSHTDDDWTPEQVEDFYDAMSPLNDQLVQAPTWWILELWPVQYKVPTTPGQVSVRTGMNLGRWRGIEDFEPNLHWTVRHRVQHAAYKIEARTAPHTKWRTVV